MITKTTIKTFDVYADIFHSGQFYQSINFVITSDKNINNNQAKNIINILYPEFNSTVFLVDNMQYSIRALSTSSMHVYFCASVTQGEKFVPFADSMAYVFNTKKEATAKLKQLKEQYVGLTQTMVVYQRINY